MNYADEWIVLSSLAHPDDGYIVLAYRGTNAAWEWDGGLNIYTRQPMKIKQLIEIFMLLLGVEGTGTL